MTVLEVLNDASKWTKGYPAKNSQGELCSVVDPDAVCFCLDGALIKAYGDGSPEYWHARKALLNAKTKLFANRPGLIVGFNDDGETTFEDVVAVVKEAGV